MVEDAVFISFKIGDFFQGSFILWVGGYFALVFFNFYWGGKDSPQKLPYLEEAI